MPVLDLISDIELRRAARERFVPVHAVEGRAMNAVTHALRHQSVIGRMELDPVEPMTPCVDGAQFRRIFVRLPREVEAFG